MLFLKRPDVAPLNFRRPLVYLNHVVKQYASPAGRFTALDDVDLEIDAGAFVTIVGKSGCGKSTLVNMITGIDRPTSGEIMIAGTDLTALTEGQVAVWRGKTIGVVFQFFQLLPTLTVVENVMLPMDLCGVHPAHERYDRALHLLELVNMADQAMELPRTLSGGQQQSAAIARALATDPPLVAADEPTGNLDSRAAEAVFALFEQLADGGKTILVVTHDDELARRGRRTIVLSDGRIVDPGRR